MSAILSSEEVREAAGGYQRPHDQLRVLKERGFYRAFRSPVTGEVVLERPHYDAVSQGLGGAANAANQPMLRSERRAKR